MRSSAPEPLTLIPVNHTQAYKQAYLNFQQLSRAQKNYLGLQVFFNAADDDRRETEDEAAQHGYGMNADVLDDENATCEFLFIITFRNGL